MFQTEDSSCVLCVFPEAEKPLVFCAYAWPEGTLVKQFVGKLLKDYVLEVYSSNEDGVDSPPSADATRGNGGNRGVVVVNGGSKPPLKPKVPSKTTKTSSGGVTVSGSPKPGGDGKSPGVISPSKKPRTRNQLKNP